MIKVEDLKDGYVYKIKARNAHYGIWYAEARAFLISREKFGDIYLFYEVHKDADNIYGTAVPIEEMGVTPFKELPLFKDILGSKRDDILSYLREKEKKYYLDVYSYKLER